VFVAVRALLRVARHVRRHGAAATAQRIMEQALRLVHVHERHVWYVLPLGAEYPHRSMPAGLELLQGISGDIPLLEQLDTVPEQTARTRLSAGTELWLAREGPRAAFACWIFHGQAPVLAARKGWLELPAGMAVLEDSVTHPEFRGRGVAPAVWAAVADSLSATGVTHLVTKVDETNKPSQRAVEKAGFEVIATVDFLRVTAARRIRVAPTDLGGRLASCRVTFRRSLRPTLWIQSVR